MKKGLFAISLVILVFMITTSIYSQTISSLPYLESFDTTTSIDLPMYWDSYLQTASVNSTISVFSTPTYAPSDPNVVCMINSTSPNDLLYLIAPPLADTINANTIRVRFKAKGDDYAYSLTVGIMDLPVVPLFTEVQTISLTDRFQEYSVDLNTYQGQGKYIAFHHDLGGSFREISIDDVQFELIPTNDLEASAISGNNYLQMGQLNRFTVKIKNQGTTLQSSYTVKLINELGIELASAPGIEVEPGEAVQVPIYWSAIYGGAKALFGSVVLDGDENASNNLSFRIPVLVNSPLFDSKIIGLGDFNLPFPIGMYWRNTLVESVYHPDELSYFEGLIKGIQLYNNFNTELLNMPVKVWMGTTTLPDLANAWIPSTQLDLVFDGRINFPMGHNTITIPFDTPFQHHYDQNLVLMINRPIDIQAYDIGNTFQGHMNSYNNQTRYVFSDEYVINPNYPPMNDVILRYSPKETFIYLPSGMGSISGRVCSIHHQPLANVNISLGNVCALTDDAGFYHINVPSNTYTVTYAAPGYQEQIIHNVTVFPNQDSICNVDIITTANSDIQSPCLESVLEGNAPNPFNPTTVISYNLKDSGLVCLEVFNLKGQKVRTLVKTSQATGHYRVAFDGRDDSNRPLASGIYYYRLKAGTYCATKRMILLK